MLTFRQPEGHPGPGGQDGVGARGDGVPQEDALDGATYHKRKFHCCV